MNAKRLIRAYLTLWAIFVFTSSCRKKEEKLDLGTMQGAFYKNNYFRLTVKIPEAWHV